jgi:hypothetical protein
MPSYFTPSTLPIPRSQPGEPAWEIAMLFPPQGHWTEEEYLALDTSAVVIENKVGSQEHSDQLNRYQGTMKEHYPDLRPLYVFLRPDGDEPSEDTWLPYTYAMDPFSRHRSG